ncbi:GLutaRedoXin [Datura stramonium]|uniref:GLutaRedoXin n=1 Tax=Datura stramonium TaxID=4076 RepID=A0ABS8RUD5_DATST|nr:GLutaRedoXin [Datura stramonium]
MSRTTSNRNLFPSSSAFVASGEPQQSPDGLGVNPKVFEIEEAKTDATLEELSKIKSRCGEGGGGPKKLPVVYLGGELLGGVEKVVEMHNRNELIVRLKEVEALCL